MKIALDHALLETAQRLGPTIRAHADEAERERRLSRPVVEALAGAGLLRLLSPRALGGLEVDPVTCARLIEEIAGFDSAAGWMLMVANQSHWWCARLPAQGVESIFENGPDTLMAGAFHPPQQATVVDGGYRITGRAPFASHIHHADWLLLTALVQPTGPVEGTGSAPGLIAGILPVQEAEILETWDSLGMRGSDSNDVAVSDCFVPIERTFVLTPEFVPGPHFQGPLYRFPGVASAVFTVTPVTLAIARAALTEWRTLAQRKTPFGSSKSLRERPAAQALLAQAEADLRAARLLFYDTLTDAWERTQAGESASLEQRADLLLAGVHAVSGAVQAVERLFRAAGTSAIYTRNPLERHFRDIQTLRHHGFVSESRYETVGQVYLGVPPEFGLVAF